MSIRPTPRGAPRPSSIPTRGATCAPWRRRSRTATCRASRASSPSTPTGNRNRGLDLWPLLGHLAPGVCARLRGRPVANARPAFHYRLPDSRLGQPGWSPRQALAQWDRLEAAADDPDAFEALRRACLDNADWRIGHAEYLDAVAGVLG